MAQNKGKNRPRAAQPQQKKRTETRQPSRPTRQTAAPQAPRRSVKSQRAYFRKLRMEQQAQKDSEAAGREQGIPMWGKTLIAVAVVLLLMLVFFRVQHVEVSGNVRYTPEEVAEASGITLGDVLMGVNKTKAASRILTKLPYVEQVEVTKSLPGTVGFALVECQAFVLAKSEVGTKWLLNSQGKVLEKVDDSEESAYPLIQGTLLTMPVAGDPAAFDNPALGDQAMAMAADISAAGLSSQIRTIHVGEKTYLSYQNRIQVDLGDGSDLPYRLQYLIAALSKLEDNARGTLDLSFASGSQAIFHPMA